MVFIHFILMVLSTLSYGETPEPSRVYGCCEYSDSSKKYPKWSWTRIEDCKHPFRWAGSLVADSDCMQHKYVCCKNKVSGKAFFFEDMCHRVKTPFEGEWVETNQIEGCAEKESITCCKETFGQNTRYGLVDRSFCKTPLTAPAYMNWILEEADFDYCADETGWKICCEWNTPSGQRKAWERNLYTCESLHRGKRIDPLECAKREESLCCSVYSPVEYFSRSTDILVGPPKTKYYHGVSLEYCRDHLGGSLARSEACEGFDALKCCCQQEFDVISGKYSERYCRFMGKYECNASGGEVSGSACSQGPSPDRARGGAKDRRRFIRPSFRNQAH